MTFALLIAAILIGTSVLIFPRRPPHARTGAPSPEVAPDTSSQEDPPDADPVGEAEDDARWGDADASGSVGPPSDRGRAGEDAGRSASRRDTGGRYGGYFAAKNARPDDDFHEDIDLLAFAEQISREDPATLRPARPRAEPGGDDAPDALPATIKRRRRTDPVQRIEDFDTQHDDLEIAIAEGAEGEVMLRQDGTGMTILVDGKAVAFLDGVSTLDPDRIRVTAA